MTINPTNPTGPRPADQSLVESARTASRPPADTPRQSASAPEAEGPRTDSVRVSDEARALASQREARPTDAAIAPERLREIGERLATGYYDQPGVIEELARRIATRGDL